MLESILIQIISFDYFYIEDKICFNKINDKYSVIFPL